MGIDASEDGDIILVSPGTYKESLKILKKKITLKSLQGPNSTIIDGNQIGNVVSFTAIFSSGASAISGFTITNAKYSGIYCSDASTLIENNIITQNKGGGVSGMLSCPKIIHNTISNNSDSGISFNEHSWPEVISNIIRDNATTTYGGGIKFYYKSGITIVNNFITGNSAQIAGGGICCTGFANGDMINNTIVGNSAPKGGGVSLNSSPSDNTMINCIVWGNTASLGPQIHMADPSPTLEISYSNVQGGQANVHVEPGCVLLWGKGMIDSDPRFLSPQDPHLSMESPCINRGTLDQAPSLDFDNHQRPYMGTVDMGADEFIYMHSLHTNCFSISESIGGSIIFYLTGGSSNIGRDYLLFTSLSGTCPGTVLPTGAVLPINWDGFTTIALGLVSTPYFYQFAGTLNSSFANFRTNGPVPGLAGLTLTFAFALDNPWDYVSNPINVEITP